MLAEREKATGVPVLCVLYNGASGSPCADTTLAQLPVPPLTHSLSTSHMYLSSPSHLLHVFWLPMHGHGHDSTLTYSTCLSPYPQNSTPHTNTLSHSDLMLLCWADAWIMIPVPGNAPVPISLLAHSLQNSRNPRTVISWVSVIALEMGRKRWVYAPKLGYDIGPFRGTARELPPEPAVTDRPPFQPHGPWPCSLLEQETSWGDVLLALLHHCSVKEERGEAARIHLADS